LHPADAAAATERITTEQAQLAGVIEESAKVLDGTAPLVEVGRCRLQPVDTWRVHNVTDPDWEVVIYNR
jgi:hypothetical protein